MSSPALVTPIDAEQQLSERQLRTDLAAAYRLIHHFGMDDTIYTHLSVRVPGPEHHFLINPYGMTFDEITASSLVKIDLDGNPVGESPHPVNPAGLTIHSAVHMAREDARCVMHTHTTAGMAVAALKRGLLPLNQMSLLFYDRLAYHDYEGAALDLDERDRIAADLGDRPALILRHHGLLTVGRTVAEAFFYIYYLEQACRLQLAALQTGEEIVVAPREVCEHYRRQESEFDTLPKGERMWPALLRRLDRIDPSYRD